MTWISPITAPMMPMVGEYPPAASKTSASATARLSASVRTFLKKASLISSASVSSEARPCLRALVAWPITCSMAASGACVCREKTCANRNRRAS